MPASSELLLLAILSGCILPPLFMRNWGGLGWCVLIGLGLCAALYAILWATADPRVFLARVNTVYALFAAAALLLGALIRATLFAFWPPRRLEPERIQPAERLSE
jgi:hypothetical protein